MSNQITLNLNEVAKSRVLSESWLKMFGSAIKGILKMMMGDKPLSESEDNAELPVKIKGTPAQVEAFAKAIGSEKKYLEAWTSFGMKDPKTAFQRASLDKAIAEFERATKIKWPFK